MVRDRCTLRRMGRLAGRSEDAPAGRRSPAQKESVATKIGPEFFAYGASTQKETPPRVVDVRKCKGSLSTWVRTLK